MPSKRSTFVILPILSLVFLTFALATPAQSTSTSGERAHWVEITHNLENSPFDANLSRQGDNALKRLGEVHDIHIVLCPPLLTEFSGMKYAYTHAIARQYMLANGAFVIENPGKAGDAKATNLAAVESVLKMYQAILQQKPNARVKALDDLLEKQSHGELSNVLEPCAK